MFDDVLVGLPESHNFNNFFRNFLPAIGCAMGLTITLLLLLDGDFFEGDFFDGDLEVFGMMKINVKSAHKLVHL